ncbi:MAG: hypothetical protein ACSNEK_04875 [Parachlamydiaceae bacterium]
MKTLSSFLLLFPLVHCFVYSNETSQEPPFIIYLKGSCSAGKSTLIRSLSNQNLPLEVVDEDAIMQQSYVSAVATRFPHEFVHIQQAIDCENLYHAMREKDILFKKMASEDECKKAAHALVTVQEELNKPENLAWKLGVSQSIDHLVLKQIKQAIEQQKIVLLDTWYVKPKHLKVHFPKERVVRVLLYCPLRKAYERFIKRNEQALSKEDLSEKRYLRQLIGSYFSLYAISLQPQPAIDQVTQHELQNLFSSIAPALRDGPDVYQKSIFTFEELSRPLFNKLVSEYLPNLRHSGPSTIFYITPQEEYDIILNGKESDEQIIKLIKGANG